MHIAYFSDVITEESSTEIAPILRKLPCRDDAIARLLSVGSQERFAELALTPTSLSNWTDVAYAMQSGSVYYEPKGCTKTMDMFYCRPLAILGITKQQWLEDHLRGWENFVDNVEYHEVEGALYTMLLPEHVPSFQRRFKRVLSARGI